MSQDSVKSLMNTMVISVLPETFVLVAIDMILANNFNGIPVTDTSGVLVGILTKYDLISKRDSIRDDTKVSAVMNVDPLVIAENASVDEAIKAFTDHHKVDPIPVISEDRRVVGVISRYDMVKLFREYGVSSDPGPKDTYPPAKSKQSFLWLYILILFMAMVLAYLFINRG